MIASACTKEISSHGRKSVISNSISTFHVFLNATSNDTVSPKLAHVCKAVFVTDIHIHGSILPVATAV